MTKERHCLLIDCHANFQSTSKYTRMKYYNFFYHTLCHYTTHAIHGQEAYRFQFWSTFDKSTSHQNSDFKTVAELV